MQKNLELRKIIKDGNLRHWQIANAVGVSEVTFCKWLRYDLPPEKETLILNAIAKLRKGEE